MEYIGYILSAPPTLKLLRHHCELNNLLYALHTTPVIDHIGLATIAKQTSVDCTLKKVSEYVKAGQTWMPKEDSIEIRKFKPILPELTLTGNGILLKEDRIVLPEALQMKAIELAHRGAHPGRSGMERRLRYHFFFHNMFKKVEQFVNACEGCSRYVDKKTKEPIKHLRNVGKRLPLTCLDHFFFFI
jgi:hypothetical protein